jgi:hypothetical protein
MAKIQYTAASSTPRVESQGVDFTVILCNVILQYCLSYITACPINLGLCVPLQMLCNRTNI